MERLRLDFVKEQEVAPKYWLIGLVSFSLAPAVFPRSLSASAVADKDELHIALTCKMCGLKFKYKEITNCLPLSALLETREHMRQRSVPNIFARLTALRLSSLHDCKICALCYSLVVQEKALIEAEKRMALAQSIPVRQIGVGEKGGGAGGRRGGGGCVTSAKNLVQWRSMVYAMKIRVSIYK